MEVYDYTGEGFKVLMRFEEWRVAILRYNERFSNFTELERHLSSDEAFVLLEGSATLYEDEIPYEMEKNKLYNIPKGVWHHITVSPDASVLVIENSNISKDNSERRSLSEGEMVS